MRSGTFEDAEKKLQEQATSLRDYLQKTVTDKDLTNVMLDYKRQEYTEYSNGWHQYQADLRQFIKRLDSKLYEYGRDFVLHRKPMTDFQAGKFTGRQEVLKELTEFAHTLALADHDKSDFGVEFYQLLKTKK